MPTSPMKKIGIELPVQDLDELAQFALEGIRGIAVAEHSDQVVPEVKPPPLIGRRYNPGVIRNRIYLHECHITDPRRFAIR